MSMKMCKSCNIEKLETEFYSYKYSKDRLRYQCKDCCKLVQKERREKNPKQQSDYSNRWMRLNDWHNKTKEKLRPYRAKYIRERRQTDTQFKLKDALRSRLRKALKSKYWYKNSKFNEYIGCSLEILKTHIENQFKEGMTWENHGLHTWHIDHIIPLSSANTENEIYKLCHYTNLQPLWAIDNIKKGCKVA